MPKLQRLPEEHIEYAYGIFCYQSHRLIKALKRAVSPRARHARKSAYLLVDYLQEHPPAKNRKIMELGCGWVLPLCFAISLSKVAAVDLDPAVFPC